MIKEFTCHFEELGIMPEDLYELLGFENNMVPDPFPGYIEEALNTAPLICDIRGGYGYFRNIKIDNNSATIQIENQLFSPSKIVTSQLKDAESVVLFLCTAGEEITNHSNKISTESDPMLGYVFDVLGSVTVDKAMDKIQADLSNEMKNEGLGISDRYSPGYCDWNVGEQHKLFSLLPKDFCNIKLSDSSLMHPIKSISGIIGIGPNLEQKGYQCNWCDDVNCLYGKIRRKKN